MENNIFNQRERDNKKIIIAFFFSIIMIFSAFVILNFTTTAEKSNQTINNHSIQADGPCHRTVDWGIFKHGHSS